MATVVRHFCKEFERGTNEYKDKSRLIKNTLNNLYEDGYISSPKSPKLIRLKSKGIELILGNLNQDLKPKMNSSNIQDSDVFVTYSWEGEEHNSNVVSFVNFLRENGINAQMDKSLAQNETAIDFSKMMHKGISNFNKVIIILSKTYKQKAEKFIGGVGQEYELIIKEINEKPQKYILCCFGNRTNDIFPLMFKNRDTIDISKQENNNSLFAKLLDKEIIQFSEVAPNPPKIVTDEIPKFEQTHQLEKLNSDYQIEVSAYKFELKEFRNKNRTQLVIFFTIENIGNRPISFTELKIHYKPNPNIVFNCTGRISPFADTMKLQPGDSKIGKSEMKDIREFIFITNGLVKQDIGDINQEDFFIEMILSNKQKIISNLIIN